MTETITETILPGTYIEVRAEGLLSIGAIATGNVALLGTAERGGGETHNLGSYEEGRALFGEPGAWVPSAGADNLSLTRALKLLFGNGARTVYARRVFDPDSAASGTARIAAGGGTLTLRSSTPGSWSRRLALFVDEAIEGVRVEDEVLKRDAGGNYALSASQLTAPADASASLGVVTVRDEGLTTRYQLKTSAPSSSVAQVNVSSGAVTFAAPPSATADVRASYNAPREALRRVTLTFGTEREAWVVPSIGYLAQRLSDETAPSRLAAVASLAGEGLPDTLEKPVTFEGGADGQVSRDHFSAALDQMVAENVQIVVVAGRTFSEMKGPLLAHLEKTENLGRERMALIGADGDDVDRVVENANEVADKRLILVAPGIAETNTETGRVVHLPPWCTAAAVAGRLASVSPHVSLTNKTLQGIDGLSVAYDYGALKALVLNRVLAVQERRGLRVVKAITTDTEAFKQISVRRVTDHIKTGTRIGADQYIGKLNNRRVRENLRSTLDAFLASLVGREFLTGYSLEVSADRAQEIRGEVSVTMDLKPTFSIDVIRVVANLS